MISWHPILAFIAAFLLGSVPTAYLLVRKGTSKDLRVEGSGNIGTLNAYEVTRSKRIGVAVLLIDLAKGALPQLALRVLLPDVPYTAEAALLGVVAGHNYSPWIGWKGGRGLAPAAGASLLYAPVFLAAWLLYWLAAYAKSRDVHFANIAATVLSPLTVLLATDVFVLGRLPATPDTGVFILTLLLLSVLVMLRHAGPLRELLSRAKRRN